MEWERKREMKRMRQERTPTFPIFGTWPNSNANYNLLRYENRIFLYFVDSIQWKAIIFSQFCARYVCAIWRISLSLLILRIKKFLYSVHIFPISTIFSRIVRYYIKYERLGLNRIMTTLNMFRLKTAEYSVVSYIKKKKSFW